MGVQIWTEGPFDPRKCASACTATSVYDLSHGFSQTCQFFNTYLLLMNGLAVGREYIHKSVLRRDAYIYLEYCAMYNQTWSSSYATNTGYVRNNIVAGWNADCEIGNTAVATFTPSHTVTATLMRQLLAFATKCGQAAREPRLSRILHGYYIV